MTTTLHGTRTRRRRNIGSHVVLSLLMLYFLFPLWWLFVAATKDKFSLFSSAHGSFWFDDTVALWDNIVEVSNYDGGIYWRWLGNSLLYAVAGGVGATVISVLAGYGFARYRFPGRSVLFFALLGSIMVPVTALTIPNFIVMSSLGLINTVWAVILPSLLSPIGVYLMRVYVETTIPNELIEAGRVDGAGEMRILLRVVLPLLRPGAITVLLLLVTATWNNYFLPLVMLSDTRLLPVTVGLQRWLEQATVTSGSAQAIWNLVITGSLLSIIPVIAAFLMLQRHWQSGLALGALK